METAIWIAIGVFSPSIILWFCKKVKFAQQLGPVLLACLLGIVLGQIDFVPKAQTEVQEYGLNISILVGLSILFFSFNIRDQYKVIKPGLKSAIIAFLSLSILILVGHAIWGKYFEEGWKLTGMLVGVYTGGTPNLATLSTALNVQHEMFVWVHSIDAMVSSIYLLVVLYLANGIRGSKEQEQEQEPGELMEDKNIPVIHRIYAIIVGVIISAIAGLGMLIESNNQIVLIILILSTLGIAASFIPSVKKIKGTYSTSLYFILIFCVFIGSEVNLRNLADINLSLFVYLFVVLIGTFALHMIMGRWAKVGKDLLLITSVAMICSPPFVPAVALALGRKDLLPIGISVGIMGYLLGNYLGISLAYLIHLF